MFSFGGHVMSQVIPFPTATLRTGGRVRASMAQAAPTSPSPVDLAKQSEPVDLLLRLIGVRHGALAATRHPGPVHSAR